ncbi:MAG: hypothetical protein ACRDYD_11770 [Acidimicrobiales bacterium]
MTQPEYVPITSAERIRPVRRLPAPAAWSQGRPAELLRPEQPSGASLGVPGPDQGYAMGLAQRFRARLVLTEGEHAEDAEVGAVAVALRRAALFDRAPVVFDLEHAFTLWGFLGEPPADLVAYRKALFQGVAHDYWLQRSIAAQVPDAALRRTPAQVRDELGDWRALLELA